MELTAPQQQVVDHHDGRLWVLAPRARARRPRSAARYVPARRRSTDASRLLVLCRNRGAAIRFRDAVLPDLAGGFDALPITTYHGVRTTSSARARGPVRLLVGAEQRAIVRELLAGEGEAEWPKLHPLLGHTRVRRRGRLGGARVPGRARGRRGGARHRRPRGASSQRSPPLPRRARWPRRRRCVGPSRAGLGVDPNRPLRPRAGRRSRGE